MKHLMRSFAFLVLGVGLGAIATFLHPVTVEASAFDECEIVNPACQGYQECGESCGLGGGQTGNYLYFIGGDENCAPCWVSRICLQDCGGGPPFE